METNLRNLQPQVFMENEQNQVFTVTKHTPYQSFCLNVTSKISDIR